MRWFLTCALLFLAITGCQPKAPEPDGPAPEIFQRQKTLCERRGGRWGQGGENGFYVCYRNTKDNGKHCEKAGDCEGLCLAKSQTCAPVTPLYGCQDILNDIGARETLCLD